MNSLQSIANHILKQKEVLIFTHESPDGDCLGSSLALSSALNMLNIKNYVINKDKIPKSYSYLKGSDKIVLPSLLSDNYNIAIFVDCADIYRIGFDFNNSFSNVKEIINIDHHISNDNFGDFNHVNAEAAASGELIYELIKLFPININTEIATALYTTLVTDTGSFRYDNTTYNTFIIAAELLKLGAQRHLLNEFLFESKPVKYYKALVEVLNNLSINSDGSIAWSYLNEKIIRELDITDEYMNGLVNYPKSIMGVKVGIFFKEMDENLVKVSFRSKGDYNVNELAKKFSGGGHKKAAGCKFNSPIEIAIKEVLKSAEKMFN